MPKAFPFAECSECGSDGVIGRNSVFAPLPLTQWLKSSSKFWSMPEFGVDIFVVCFVLVFGLGGAGRGVVGFVGFFNLNFPFHICPLSESVPNFGLPSLVRNVSVSDIQVLPWILIDSWEEGENIFMNVLK